MSADPVRTGFSPSLLLWVVLRAPLLLLCALAVLFCFSSTGVEDFRVGGATSGQTCLAYAALMRALPLYPQLTSSLPPPSVSSSSEKDILPLTTSVAAAPKLSSGLTRCLASEVTPCILRGSDGLDEGGKGREEEVHPNFQFPAVPACVVPFGAPPAPLSVFLAGALHPQRNSARVHISYASSGGVQ